MSEELRKREPQKVWVNVYCNSVTNELYIGDTYKTKEQALFYAHDVTAYIKTIEITDEIYKP